MDLKKLGQQAKGLIDKRGGTESVKEDADELKDIAKGKGSLADKAKAAVEAIKDPGADEPEAPVAADASEPERARAAEKVEGEERGKHAGEKGHGGGRGGHGVQGRHRGRDGGGGGDPAV